jgi:hypothetical protein
MKEKLPVIKSSITEEKLREQNPKAGIVSYLIPAVVFDCGKYKLLVELVSGGIVIDIDSSSIIRLPGLDEISMNELAVLEQGFQLGQFSGDDIKLNVSQEKVESILSGLLSKKLVMLQNKKYAVTDRFKILYNTGDYATKEKIVTEEVEGTKIDAKFSVGKIKERIDSIVKVYGEQECWILYNRFKY